jgi:hypothetical protein
MLETKHKRIFAWILVCMLFITGCTGKARSATEKYSASLIVYPHATNIKFVKNKGMDQLTYRVSEKFPAKEVISTISKKLEEMGWIPLKTDFFNPELPSSHVTGWTKFIDAPRKQVVHSWAADWKDSSENIVRYTMQYRYPEKGKPNLTDLEVITTYMPKQLALQGLEAARRLQQESQVK